MYLVLLPSPILISVPLCTIRFSICDALNHLISGGNTDDCAIVSNPDIDYTAAGVGKGNDILTDAFCIVQFQFDCLAFQEAGECLFISFFCQS